MPDQLLEVNLESKTGKKITVQVHSYALLAPLVIQAKYPIKNEYLMSTCATYLVSCRDEFDCLLYISVTNQCPRCMYFDKFDQLSHGSWFGLVGHNRGTFHTLRV